MMSAAVQHITSSRIVSAFRARVAASPFLGRLAGGVGWTLAGNLAWRGLSGLCTILLARILGPAGFGEFGMVQSTVNIFKAQAGLGLASTPTRYIAQYRATDPGKAARVMKLTSAAALALSVPAALVLALFARPIASEILGAPHLALALALGAALVVLSLYETVIEGALAGFTGFKAIAGTNLLRGGLTLAFCLPLARYWGAGGAIAGLIIVSAAVLVPLLRAFDAERQAAGFPARVSLGDAWREKRALVHFALPGFLVGILFTAMEWLGRLTLAWHADGYAEVGIFNAAEQWRTMILFLPAVLVRVALPLLAEAAQSSRHDAFVRTAISQFQAINIIALPLTVLVIGFAGPIAVLFGKAFQGVDRVLVILMVSVFFFAQNQSLRQILDSSGRRWASLSILALWSAVFSAGCLVLSRSQGACGLAVAHLAAQAVTFIATMAYTDTRLLPGLFRRTAGLSFFALSVIGTAAAVRLATTESPAATGALSLLLALALLPVLRRFKPER